MSNKFNTKRGRESGLAGVIQNLQSRFNRQGAELVNQRVGALTVSAEALSDNDFELLDRYNATADAVLADSFKGANLGLEGYTEAQLEAGRIIMAAAGNPAAYARSAMTVQRPQGGAGIAVVDTLPAGLDYRPIGALDVASMEAFDDRKLVDHVPFSVVVNMQTAVQDEFSEAFYKTVVLTPDQPGLEIVCQRTMIFNRAKHENTGKPTDFGRTHLVDATVDHRILASDVAKAIPVYDPVVGATENHACFAPIADVAPYDYTVAGETFKTAPLALNRPFDLLGLSQTPALLRTGILDNTDSLDLRVVLKKVYVKIHAATGNVTTVVPLTTLDMPTSRYQHAQEGNDRQLNLAFSTKSLTITGATKNLQDVAAPALAYLADPLRVNWVVRLAMDVNGRIDTETGEGIVGVTGTVRIDSVWKYHEADDTYTQILGLDLTALQAEIDSFTVVGVDIDAGRSNLNRREVGTQTSTLTIRERHTIFLGPPITCPSPVTATRTSAELAAPIQVARVRNSNNAVTKLLGYATMLENLKLGLDRSQPVPEIEGLGRLLIRPYFERSVLNMQDVLQSARSQDRAADVSASIINRIRDMAYRMYRNSNYQGALDSMTGGTGERPVLIIGTDQYTQRHLMVDGDTRTAGIGFDYRVVVSPDMRVFGKIFLGFARPNQSGPDLLSPGCMAFVPELATNLQISRDGRTTMETMIQQRTLHINTCPLLGVIEIENLEVAVSEQVPFAMRNIP
jgi:hypothetical protein